MSMLIMSLDLCEDFFDMLRIGVVVTGQGRDGRMTGICYIKGNFCVSSIRT